MTLLYLSSIANRTRKRFRKFIYVGRDLRNYLGNFLIAQKHEFTHPKNYYGTQNTRQSLMIWWKKFQASQKFSQHLKFSPFIEFRNSMALIRLYRINSLPLLLIDDNLHCLPSQLPHNKWNVPSIKLNFFFRFSSRQ